MDPLYGGGAAAEAPADESIPTSPGSEGGELSDFDMAADEAMDAALPPEQRRAALKEAIRLCYEEDKAGDAAPESKGEKGKGGLALIFGTPEKKK